LRQTSEVTVRTPVVVENGMHQPWCPGVYSLERLGRVAEGEDVGAQLCQRQFGHELNALLAAPGPGPGAGQRRRHRGDLSAADGQAPPVEGTPERHHHW